MRDCSLTPPYPSSPLASSSPGWYNTFLRYFEAEQIHVPEHMTIHRVKYEGHRYDKYGQAMSAEAAAKQDAANKEKKE